MIHGEMNSSAASISLRRKRRHRLARGRAVPCIEPIIRVSPSLDAGPEEPRSGLAPPPSLHQAHYSLGQLGWLSLNCCTAADTFDATSDSAWAGVFLLKVTASTASVISEANRGNCGDWTGGFSLLAASTSVQG